MNKHEQTTNPPHQVDPTIGKQNLMHRITREPFVLFAILSIAIFGWFKLAQPAEWKTDPDARVIVIEQRQIDLLAAQFEDTWRRAPTEEELNKLKDDWLNREVLVREALALGLDGNDEIIRNRLVQKMNFLLASAAVADRPDDETLQAYISDNAERFAVPARFAASLVYLGQYPGDTYVDETLDRLASGEDHRHLGQASLLPSGFDLSVQTTIDGSLGAGFSDQLKTLPLGEWIGPVQSTFGQHLVRLDHRQDAFLPPLDEIRERVLSEWREKQTQKATQEFLSNLKSTYSVQDTSEPVEPAVDS